MTIEHMPLAMWLALPCNKPKNKSPENAVKRACRAWLKARRILHNRQQSGRIKVINPKTRKEYWVTLADEGSGDIVGCTKKGRYFEIETKPEKGKQSAEQRAHQARVEADGGIYIIAQAIEDIEILLTS